MKLKEYGIFEYQKSGHSLGTLMPRELRKRQCCSETVYNYNTPYKDDVSVKCPLFELQNLF